MAEIFSNVGDRIQQLLDLSHMKNVQLAKSTGISANAISNYINNKRIPDTASIYKISKALGASIEWLLAGEGEMLIATPTPIYDVSPPEDWPLDELDVEQKQILFLFGRLNQEEKEIAKSYLLFLNDSHSRKSANLPSSHPQENRPTDGGSIA